MSNGHPLTVIVPTIGRSSLRATLASFASDLRADDLVIVATDGVRPEAEEVFDDFSGGEANWMLLPCHESHDWGHSLRNEALDRFVEEGRYVWTLDDDDVATPGALEALRSRMDGGWAIFRMEFGPAHFAYGITCWREKQLRFGDIGTPMTLAPRCGARFGSRYEGDWDYVQSLQVELGAPTWDDRVIALIRPEEVHE